ncbi:hypothetical protein, partial [Brevibacterium sp. NPDC056947]|uniref:hypothetical protein n=1 Tax=Brevibacterium sp. NPDC056947 TaxID=3345974 RepID=UPI00362E8D17
MLRDTELLAALLPRDSGGGLLARPLVSCALSAGDALVGTLTETRSRVLSGTLCRVAAGLAAHGLLTAVGLRAGLTAGPLRSRPLLHHPGPALRRLRPLLRDSLLRDALLPRDSLLLRALLRTAVGLPTAVRHPLGSAVGLRRARRHTAALRLTAHRHATALGLALDRHTTTVGLAALRRPRPGLELRMLTGVDGEPAAAADGLSSRAIDERAVDAFEAAL